MKRVIFVAFILHISFCGALHSHAQDADSLRVVMLLAQGQREATWPLHLWYARQLLGVPYVGQTLEVNPEERLVVNLRELDCTTFVETALALALTHAGGSLRFEDYCRNLTRIRYRDGLLDGYPSRNHYFTQWIGSNERLGIVRELTSEKAPFTAVQTLDLRFMSAHPQFYPMLKSDTASQRLIRSYEQADSGRRVRYIPRARLDQSHDSPLGVVLEPMTLYQYMGKHPSQLGIRVIRPLFD